MTLPVKYGTHSVRDAMFIERTRFNRKFSDMPLRWGGTALKPRDCKHRAPNGATATF